MNLVTKNSGSLSYRADIDGLRAVAVLAVVFFHFDSRLLPGGFVGVDIFLIISGFLITGILIDRLQREAFSLKEFYSRRVLRIFPALILVLIFGLTLGWVALYPVEYVQLGKHAFGGAVFISNIILRREVGYFDISADSKPFLHLWSLSLEEQFYIFWPLILYVSWRRKYDLFKVTIGLLIASYAANLYVNFVRENSVSAFFLLPSRAWEFMLGGMLCQLKKEGMSSKLRDGLSLVALISLFLSFIVIDQGAAFPGYVDLVPTVAAAVLILVGPTAFINRHILGHPIIVLIGLISYPLYLWHWPLLSFLRIVEYSIPPRQMEVGAVVISFILAFLTYKFVEMPLRKKQDEQRRRRYVWILSSILLLLGGSGYFVKMENGFPSRKNFEISHEVIDQFLRPPSTDSACETYVSLPDRMFDYCLFRKVPDSRQVVALIGDSHAHAAFHGFAEWFSRHGVSTILLANSGCPTFPNAVVGDSKLDREQCAKKIAQIYKVLESHQEISRILFFSRGPLYISGRGFGRSERDLDDRGKFVGMNGSKDLSPSELFEQGIVDFAQLLTKEGKRVTYVLDVPEVGFNPMACLKRPLSVTPPKCNIELAEVLKRQHTYRELLKKAKTRAAELELLDPLPSFCQKGLCPVGANGKTFYRDDDHLSVYGSERLAPLVLSGYLKQSKEGLSLGSQ